MNKQLNSVTAEQTLSALGGIPVDRMAWRVTQPGEHYDIPDKIRMLCFDVPPPIVDRRINHHHHNDQSTADLNGIRFGRLVAIGYWGRRGNTRSGGADRHLWVCRCLCGLFTIRRASVILRRQNDPNATPDMCNACMVLHLERLGVPRDIAEKFARDDRRELPKYVEQAVLDVKCSGTKWSVAIATRKKWHDNQSSATRG